MNTRIVLLLSLTLIISVFADIDTNEKAHIFEFPYLVSLKIRSLNLHFCAGVILSKWHIVTAAKCVDGKQISTSNIAIFMGNSNVDNSNSYMYTIERVNLHPDYTGQISMRSIYEHNLAIITLKESISFHTNQQKIELPTQSPKNREKAITSGWGVNSYTLEQIPRQLKKSTMTILDHLECTQLLPFVINAGQICAYKSNAVGPVDVGGPLIVNGKLVGILSYMRSSLKKDPAVYTDIYFYLNFIKNVVTKNN